MEELDYAALRATIRKAPPMTAPNPARSREQQKRGMMANQRARSALTKAFPAEYRQLLSAARAEVDAERGPLPGDIQETPKARAGAEIVDEAFGITGTVHHGGPIASKSLDPVYRQSMIDAGRGHLLP